MFNYIHQQSAWDPYNLGRWVVGVALAYQAVTLLLPAAVTLWRTRTSAPSLKHWSAQHAWFPIFLTANAMVFWLSMQSVTKQAFIETLGDWVVAGQIAVMGIAGSIVTRFSVSSPTIPVSGNSARWVVATVLPVLMNALALRHSLEIGPLHGWAKATTWIVMDVLAALFYIIILVRIPNPSRLDPPRLAFLWPWVILPMAVLSTIDIVILRAG